MKIGILSDLHTEFESYNYDLPVCDVLVLAGDIETSTCRLSNTKLQYKLNDLDIPIIRIAGNHELYDGSIADINNYPNQFIKYVGDYRFICCVGWSKPDIQSWMCVNDRFINGMMLDTMHAWSNRDWAYLERCLDTNFDGKTIVVTHYLPTSQSIDAQYKASVINSSFCCYEEALLNKYKDGIDLWIHGHTHSSMDYRFNGDSFRIVCNPKGYRNANSSFAPYKAIKL